MTCWASKLCLQEQGSTVEKAPLSQGHMATVAREKKLNDSLQNHSEHNIDIRPGMPLPDMDEKPIVTKDWKMGEIVERYPHREIVDIIGKYGLHCIGCHVASWETLEQGVLAHGLGYKELEKMLGEINREATKIDAERPKDDLPGKTSVSSCQKP